MNKFIHKDDPMTADVIKYYEKYHGVMCSEQLCENHYSQLLILNNNFSNRLLTNLVGMCDMHAEDYRNLNSRYTTISRSFYFDSAHRLLDYNGLCANLHGHRWRLDVFIKNRISHKTGMVMDYKDLKELVNKWIINKLDHFVLNDIIKINPTAENILIAIWKTLETRALLKGIDRLELWETPDSRAILSWSDLVGTNYESMYNS